MGEEGWAGEKRDSDGGLTSVGRQAGRNRNIATMVMSGSGGPLTFHRVRDQYGARAGAFDEQASPAWRRPAAVVTKRWGEGR